MQPTPSADSGHPADPSRSAESHARSIRNERAAALPAKLSRSWLLVNADRPETFEDGQASEADSVIFDLEASVPAEKKDEARANVVDALSNGMTAWVRISPDRKSTRLNSSHSGESRMPSSA